MMTLSASAREVIDAPEFVTMATIDEHGRPRLSVVWAKTDGNHILVSTTTERRKYRDLLRDPRVSLLCFPKDQPYTYVSIQGTATLVNEGGSELIQELSERYTGSPFPSDRPDVVRAVIRIDPSKVVFSDPSSRRNSSARSDS